MGDWADRLGDHYRPLLLDPPVGEMRVALGVRDGRDLRAVILLGERMDGRPYTEEDLSLLSLLSTQSTIALERPRFLKEVSGGLAHELKTPLAAIVVPVELTLLDIEDIKAGQKSASELLAVMQRRLRYVVDQIQLASRRLNAVESASFAPPMSLRPFDLSGLIENVVRQIEPLANGLQIQFDCEPCEKPLLVMGDEEQAEIALFNVMKNGLEAMEPSVEGNPTLIVRVVHAGERLGVDVIDMGAGIPPPLRDRVFEMGFTTKGLAGRGLGLPLARKIMRGFGGDVVVLESPGPGATFRIMFLKEAA